MKCKIFGLESRGSTSTELVCLGFFVLSIIMKLHHTEKKVLLLQLLRLRKVCYPRLTQLMIIMHLFGPYTIIHCNNISFIR